MYLDIDAFLNCLLTVVMCFLCQIRVDFSFCLQKLNFSLLNFLLDAYDQRKKMLYVWCDEGTFSLGVRSALQGDVYYWLFIVWHVEGFVFHSHCIV